MAAEVLRYRQRARNATTLAVVVAIWVLLFGALVLLDAALWIVLVLGAFTIPAIWELWSNPEAGLDLTEDGIAWFSGRRHGEIQWTEIDRFRLDTRLDFSVRATAVLLTGRKIRLPFECTPNHKELEAALQKRGMKTERHHFSLIG